MLSEKAMTKIMKKKTLSDFDNFCLVCFDNSVYKKLIGLVCLLIFFVPTTMSTTSSYVDCFMLTSSNAHKDDHLVNPCPLAEQNAIGHSMAYSYDENGCPYLCCRCPKGLFQVKPCIKGDYNTTMCQDSTPYLPTTRTWKKSETETSNIISIASTTLPNEPKKSELSPKLLIIVVLAIIGGIVVGCVWRRCKNPLRKCSREQPSGGDNLEHPATELTSFRRSGEEQTTEHDQPNSDTVPSSAMNFPEAKEEAKEAINLAKASSSSEETNDAQ